MRMKHLLLTTLACISAISLSSAQTASAAPSANAQATPLAYDVMTIKPNMNGTSMGMGINGDSFTAHNVTLRQLLHYACDIDEDSIAGIPSQIDSKRFDIEAKISDPDPVALKNMTPEQTRSMLLPLLVERFQLKTHSEARILPVYELIVAKGGPKIKLSEDQTKSIWGDSSFYSNKSNIKFVTKALSMASLAKDLSGWANRTVIDKTGLAGNYDLTLQWTPDDTPASTDANSAPSIYTAVQEQLGLKLQPAKGPVETLVVDHAAMPSDN